MSYEVKSEIEDGVPVKKLSWFKKLIAIVIVFSILGLVIGLTWDKKETTIPADATVGGETTIQDLSTEEVVKLLRDGKLPLLYINNEDGTTNTVSIIPLLYQEVIKINEVLNRNEIK